MEAKVVEEVFQRIAGILNLRVAGQLIRTTGEHPFYVAGLGWTPANELHSGMELLTATGEWVRVDGVNDTSEWEVVYNLRVADQHILRWGRRMGIERLGAQLMHTGLLHLQRLDTWWV